MCLPTARRDTGSLLADSCSVAHVSAGRWRVARCGLRWLRAAGCSQGQLEAQFDSLRRAFLRADRDRSGALDKGELLAIVRRYCVGLPANVLEDVFAAADANRDGSIRYHEFVELLSRRARGETIGARQGGYRARRQHGEDASPMHGRRKGKPHGYVGAAGAYQQMPLLAEGQGQGVRLSGRFWHTLGHIVRDHVDEAVRKFQREELPKVVNAALRHASTCALAHREMPASFALWSFPTRDTSAELTSFQSQTNRQWTPCWTTHRCSRPMHERCGLSAWVDK